ncbi:polysaccharide deacetylase family protein [Cryptosporangium phraense]|uniref:Polysaccharide deacetylase family protein n=1 Tax=Cryptosporangium phraense TaxID=2593070 RepID=A0A545AVG5_9ACTN|nr:polysaccharide deacetylase family protein [Cryptosporangium phraense]TQS45313.1 polysaccharide deacetylase family protein [Cryptosporangium phraense]
MSVRVSRAFRVAGALAVAQAAPALTAVTPLRRELFPVLSGRGDGRQVALTFDDGPDAAGTPPVLDVLARYRITATFFLLGTQIQRAPTLTRELVAAGHEVAVHGFEHRCLLTRTPAGTHRDLAQARDLIADLTGQEPNWYRPPYGVLSLAGLRAARRLRLRPVLWTTWGRDWEQRATSASVAATVMRRLEPGGTILLHDSDCTSAAGSWRTTVDALPRVIEDTQARGMTLGPLRDHGLS